MSNQANYQPVPYSSPSLTDNYSTSGSAKDTTPTPTSSSPSLSPSDARQEAENQGSALTIILFSLAIFTAVIGPALILLALIFAFNTFERDGLEVRTSADLQNLLTISQLVTIVVSKSVSIVIAVHAYQLAAQWLKSSDRQSSRRPSPLQLGLLISVIQGANIIAWFKVRWHLLRGSKVGKRQVIKPSPILIRAVTVLGLLLIVSNAVAGFDTWLHLSSKAVAITRMSSYSGSTLPSYGRQLNETQCEEYARGADAASAATCGMDRSIHDPWALSLPEGLQTLTNTSAKNLVVFTDDGMQSIIVSVSMEANVAYEATTLGCLKPQVEDSGYINYGDNFVPNIDCAGVYPQANISLAAASSDALPFSFVYSNNGSFGNLGPTQEKVVTNPFSLAAVVNSFAYVNGSVGDYFVNDTGFFTHGRTGAWNVLYCNTTVSDVKYRYIPASSGTGGSYQTISSTVSTVRMASLVSIGLDMGIIRKNLPSRIEGAGLRRGSYTTAFAQELSRELMGLTAALYEPVPVTAIAETSFVLGSRVQLVPLGLYLTSVIIYALTTLVIGITALIEAHSVKFVKLVHLRITREARREAENQGTALSIILFSLAIFTAILGPALILLALIFAFNTFERDGLEVRTSADLQNLLTISQLVTTVVSKSVPIVIAVHAYQLAAQWLKSSERRASGRPSPLQLGLLISVLQGANIIAWFKVRWHLLRGSKDGKRQVIEPSPILTRAVTVLGLLLIVSNAVAGLDTWLHLSSKATSQRNAMRRECKARFASAPTCGMEKSIHDPFAISLPEGTQTLTNTSAKNLVVLTEDGMQSIIVPPSTEANVAYEATTFGVGSTCMSYGDNFFPYINCAGVYPQANISIQLGPTTTDALPFGAVLPNNGSFGDVFQPTYTMITTNPFNFAAVVNSFAYVSDGGDDYFVNNTGFFRHGRTGAWNVVYCNSTVNDVKYRYIPASSGTGGSYQTISSTVSSVRMATLISIGLDMGAIRYNLLPRIDGAGLRGGSYTTAFAQELSRELMAFSSALYEPIPVTAIAETSVVLGSRVHLVPLGLYLASAAIYALTTLVIGITALMEAHSVKFVKLVHLRITSSLPIVHALFGPVDSSRTWKNEGVEMFSTESETDRLYIGPVQSQTQGESFGFARV
ncbi:hypothetical protein FRC00_000072 [Tulasnella sp. 408]|nr:hypothetical protein FRC00_000072 [Tulasnella sp. 408]